MRLGDVECDARHGSLRRYEQRLERSEKQQVIALGRLGWPLRRIEQETGVRRETAGAYLKAAGIGVRPPGAWGRRAPAKAANETEVTTGSDAAKPVNTVHLDCNPNPNPNPENLPSKGKAKATAKPANPDEVTTGFGVELNPSEQQPPQPVPSPSLCEPFRDAIELGLSQGRNAIAIWQDLVSESGFRGGYQTVKRFVRKLRGNQPPQPRAVIITAPGEESQVDYGTGPMVRDPQTGKYRRNAGFVAAVSDLALIGRAKCQSESLVSLKPIVFIHVVSRKPRSQPRRKRTLQPSPPIRPVRPGSDGVCRYFQPRSIIQLRRGAYESPAGVRRSRD